MHSLVDRSGFRCFDKPVANAAQRAALAAFFRFCKDGRSVKYPASLFRRMIQKILEPQYFFFAVAGRWMRQWRRRHPLINSEESLRVLPAIESAPGAVGLDSRYRGAEYRRRTAQTEARILELARSEPTDGATHWSSYRLAKELHGQ
jgi:hypothetical protein